MSNSFSTRSVVAMGFGFYGTVELLTTTTFADVGTTFKFMWGVISIAAYSICSADLDLVFLDASQSHRSRIANPRTCPSLIKMPCS